LTRQQFEALALAAQDDPRPFIERCYRIQTKSLPGQLPVDYLRLNKPQIKIHEAILRQRAAGLPPRVITLKARQPGVSTLVGAYLGTMLVTRPYAQTLIVAHVDDASQRLFKKVAFALRQLPEEFRPFFKSDRRNELTLRGIPVQDGEIQLETACYVGSATGDEIWRGLTLQAVHLSEAAFFPRPEETFLGVMQAVPPTPQSLVVMESTANGMGNFFQEEWIRAESGDSDFTPVFIGWWELPDAVMAVPRDFALEPSERELKRALGLTNEQVQWRRYTLYTNCGADTDLFAQEFPASPGEAFLVSGRPAFAIPVLREMYGQAQKLTPLRDSAGTFPAQGVVTEEGQFHRLARGPLTLFVPPHPDHEYMVGADVAAGVEGGDYSCAQVFDRVTDEQVATWHGHLTPVQFGRVCAGLGRLYNTAWLAPEVTGGYGFSVVEELKLVQYPKIYIWTRVDKVRQTMTNFYGWETSFRTRPLLINSMANALLERAIRIRDAETILEMMKFQYVDGRRAEGLKHDDRVIAMMIAYRTHLEYPLEKTGLPPRVKFTTDVPVVTGPPPPPRGLDREAWEETDQALKEMARGGQDMMAQFGVTDAEADRALLDRSWLEWGD